MQDPPLFDGEPEHCAVCGEPDHTHDSHWLFAEIEYLGLRAFEKHVSDDALLRECIRRGWSVIKPNQTLHPSEPSIAALRGEPRESERINDPVNRTEEEND